MKRALMVVMMIGLIAMAGVAVVPAEAGSIGVNFGDGVALTEWAGAPGYAQPSWNNTGGGSVGYLGAANPAPVEDTGAVLPGVTVSWYADTAWSGYAATGGTLGDQHLLWYALIDSPGGQEPGVLELGGIPYENYDVVVYMISNYPDRGTQVTMPGEPTYCGQPTVDLGAGTGFNGTWIQAVSTDPNNPTLGASHAVFTGQTGSSARIEFTHRTAGPQQTEGWVAGIQIVELVSPTILGPGESIIQDESTNGLALPSSHTPTPPEPPPGNGGYRYTWEGAFWWRPLLVGSDVTLEVSWGVSGNHSSDADYYFDPDGAGALPEILLLAGLNQRQLADGSTPGSPAWSGFREIAQGLDLTAESLFRVTGGGALTSGMWRFTTAAVVIPEPAGLGLIGLSLLAVRKRRS